MNDTAVPQTSVPLVSPAPSAQVVFSGERSAFRRLVVRGAFLELVTVGFYRFWLATDMRRHLWSNTSVNGDAAEYIGTPKELLIGFLFALAILAPLYLGYFLLGLEAERLQAFASIPLGLFYFLFAQFALYRARRYRLIRTIWRGVRFWMTGSGWNYAWRAGLWTLLAFVTFGLALPWRQAALERFKMRHISYGDLQGRFEGRGGDLFKRGWLLWLVLVILIFGPVALIVAQKPVLVGLSYFALIFALPFLYAMYKAIEWRWWILGLRMGEVSFGTAIGRGEFIDIYWKLTGWMLLLMVVLLIWLGGVLTLAYLMSDFTGPPQQKILIVSQQWPVLIGIGAGYVVVVLMMWALMRMYLIHDIWQRIAASVTVHNLAAVEGAVARGEAVGALGEGFADSLDVVGF